MPYAQDFIKVSFGGQISGQEIWACSFHLIGSSVTPVANFMTVEGGPGRTWIVEQLSSLHGSINGSIPEVTLEWVKFARIGTDGKYVGEAITANIAPVPGGYTEVNVSAYNGAAISLFGLVPRGEAGKGRFYPPANAVAAEDGYYIGVDVQTRLANAWGALFTNMNAALESFDIFLELGNVSEKGSGSQNYVSSVRVGSVLDVQRRRKNRIQETYIARAVA